MVRYRVFDETDGSYRRAGSMRLNVSLGAVAAANLLAALAFQWVILTTLGVGGATDALFAGMAIPQLVLSIVSGALVQVLTPLFSGEREDVLRETAWGAFLLIGGVMGGLAIALYLTAPLWVGWLLPGFRLRDLGLAVSLTRIQLPGMVFMAAVAVPLAGWNARRRFLWAEQPADRARFVSLLSPKNRSWAERAPLLLFLVARRSFTESGSENRWACFDVGAAWMALALQARRLGLHAHAMAGFSRERAHAELGVPEGLYDVVAAIAVGRRADPSLLPEDQAARETPGPRRPAVELAFEGRWPAGAR